ncbi:HlyD family type I secretion periplasmic adaptor subunit [Novosphingobium piscinae]|uniref:Membrane fusion protein (MFP) family protein n=1 Tax=Novosphingobium piscinae TaxID=1507448 RepID=A0A7X1KP36_9SPHN|nr:HlyD family type I secretion periplasmic adaptor subunit [Novosphingobium piscinae]MBC2667980.1 HlyD family type I secretion periplasmic adaptor subunit [Novosphingobium piscinae]
MDFPRLRDAIIRKFGGASLLEDLHPGEASAALAGAMPLPSNPIGAMTPWSGRPALEHPARLTRLLAIVFALLIAWAAIFTVDKVTRGTGKVIPSTQNQLVQHLEGGIVKEILVQEGQRVFKGQVMLRIANAYTGAAMENARTDVVAKRIMLARLEAEIAGSLTFMPPEELARQAPDIAASEVALFNSRRAQRMQQTGIINEQARARVAEVSLLRARLGNLRSEERLAMDQLGKLERAYAEEAISEREVLDKRAALLSLRTRIADVENQIPQSSAGVSESAARRGEIWTRMMEQAKAQAAALRLDLAKADEQYTAVADRVTREEIRAPVDGIINRLNVQTLGGVIRGGEPVAEIVPIANTVTIEARVAPKDRGDIWPGLPAKVKISAYDSTVYGALDAKVVEISPDAIQDPRGGLYYRVRLKAATTSFGPGKPVVPGMTGEVAIRSGDQTILNYILGPLIRIKDEAFRE